MSTGSIRTATYTVLAANATHSRSCRAGMGNCLFIRDGRLGKLEILGFKSEAVQGLAV